MAMLEMNCDNKDGTINWKRRARIIVLCHQLAGGTKRKLMSDLKSNPRLARLASIEWDRARKTRSAKK